MEHEKLDSITEITPLHNNMFYCVERIKTKFDFPIHKHQAYELNFICNGKGARRIVGDSIEEIDSLDMVFLGPGLEHGWEQHNCASASIREITLQLSPESFITDYLAKSHMFKLKKMVDLCAYGIRFSLDSILNYYSMLHEIADSHDESNTMLRITWLLNALSEADDYVTLSSSTFANAPQASDSRRINKVQEYIDRHYTDRIKLSSLADIVGMTESAFSRFFKLHTGTSISDYIIEKRLGVATRRLVDTQMSVSEICYDCGFNNLSHFSRCFRQKKGCTPTEFREMYKNLQSR